MPELIIVRALTEANLPAYKALRDSMLEAHPDAFTSDAMTEALRSVDSYRSRLGTDRPGGGHFTLGAFAGGTLVGALSCERDERLKVRHIGHIVGMMVSPAARGRGVGRALLNECIALARRSPGLELLTLSVTASNATARGLYLSAGFRSYGLLQRAIKLGDAYHDKELMALSL
jgi:ribosomal protein S18 acetylase RimI-like enzyme